VLRRSDAILDLNCGSSSVEPTLEDAMYDLVYGEYGVCAVDNPLLYDNPDTAGVDYHEDAVRDDISDVDATMDLNCGSSSVKPTLEDEMYDLVYGEYGVCAVDNPLLYDDQDTAGVDYHDNDVRDDISDVDVDLPVQLTAAFDVDDDDITVEEDASFLHPDLLYAIQFNVWPQDDELLDNRTGRWKRPLAWTLADEHSPRELRQMVSIVQHECGVSRSDNYMS
jgi:hypothetical protein